MSLVGLTMLVAMTACSVLLRDPARQEVSVKPGDVLFQILEGPFVGSAGDVDADGQADIVVSNRNLHTDDAARPNTVRVVSGRTPSTLWQVEGGAGFGYRIVGMGDANGDGHADIAVTTGDRHQLIAQPQEATVEMYSGATGAVLHSIEGEELGHDLDGGGDLNGDDCADLLLTYMPGIGSLGVQARSGKDASLLWSFTMPEAGKKWYAARWSGVASVGDCDADGIADAAVVMTTFRAVPEEGRVTHAMVLSGADGSLVLALPDDSASAEAHEAIDGAGDLDRDGWPDIVVGKYTSRLVTVYSGKDARELLVIAGEEHGNNFGWSVAGVGDASGDGIPDIAVGSPYFHGGGNIETGRACLYSGADGALLRVFEGDVEGNEGGFPGTGFSFGICVDGAGDLNADGYADLLVGEDRYFALGYPTADRSVAYAGGPFVPVTTGQSDK